jgi:hypothetical protein
MLVPSVNPALVTYVAGPPRRLTIQGTRLTASAPGGETVIGRSVIARAAYIPPATPTQIVVPIPDSLPTRGVRVIVGSALADPVAIGAGVQTLNVNIGGAAHNITANLPPSVARSTVAAILANLIHDSAPTDPRFTGTRVDLVHNRLIVVPGGLTDPIAITLVGGSTFAADLGLTAAQPAGAGSALISGELGSPPPISAAVPSVRLTIGAQPPVTIAPAKTTSLAALADDLQTKINAASPAVEYAAAIVVTSGVQLLVIPGAAGAVTFDATPGDTSTVTELQLHARFAVRVRVNGAESIDIASVDLPQ